jgi:hypothetical protein
MVGFFGDSENLLSALPAEFSKSEFNAIRKTIGGHPICFESARKYGIIKVVRTEPCFRKMLIDVWTNPVTGDKYTCDELERKWSQEIAEQFGQPFLVKCWGNSGRLMTPSPYSIPNYREEELEVECYRNIFVLDLEKFKSLL